MTSASYMLSTVAMLVLVVSLVGARLVGRLYEEDHLLNTNTALFGDPSNHEIFSLPTTVLVTGANCGLGLETVKHLAQRKCVSGSSTILTLVMTCRNMDKKCNKAMGEVMDANSGCESIRLLPAPLDLSNLDSIRDLAGYLQGSLHKFGDLPIPPIHVMIHNAGIAAPYEHLKYSNAYNVETHYNVHYFGHFLMTHYLWENVMAVHRQNSNRKARIVTVSEGGAVFDINPFAGWYKDEEETPPSLLSSIGLGRVYWMARNMQQMTRSKQAQLYFASELQSRYAEAITASASHPGYTLTPMYDKLYGFPSILRFMMGHFPIGSMSPSQGALTTLLATLDTTSMYVGPKFFFFGPPVVTSREDNLSKGSVHHLEWSMDRSKDLWDETMKLVGLSNFGQR